MDDDNASNPGMPRIENLALFRLVGIVGVTAPRCTIWFARMPRSATGLQPPEVFVLALSAGASDDLKLT